MCHQYCNIIVSHYLNMLSRKNFQQTSSPRNASPQPFSTRTAEYWAGSHAKYNSIQKDGLQRTMCTNCIFVLLPSTFSYTSIAKYPSDYGKCRPTSSLASEIGILFVYLNSSLNPFLYCWKKRAVRKEVKSIIRRWCYLSSVVSLH